MFEVSPGLCLSFLSNGSIECLKTSLRLSCNCTWALSLNTHVLSTKRARKLTHSYRSMTLWRF